MHTKLTVQVPRNLLENAKRYASAHHTTLTKLICAYLERIPADYLLTRNVRDYQPAPLTVIHPAELLAIL